MAIGEVAFELTAEIRSVLFSLEMQPDKPLALVLSETGCRQENISDHITWLKQEKLIRRVPIIDFGLLGLSEFTLYFSLNHHSALLENKLSSLIVGDANVSWLTKLKGRFEYGISLRAGHVGSLASILDNLFLGIEDGIAGKWLATRRSFYLYGRKFFGDNGAGRSPIILERNDRTVSLDHQQKQMVDVLSQINELSEERLAGLLSLPLAEVQKTLDQLRKLGVLADQMYAIDVSRLGVMHYKILLEAWGLSALRREELLAFCERHPNIFYAAECFGHFDFELGVEVRSEHEFREVQHQLRRLFSRRHLRMAILSVDHYLKHDNFSF